MSKYLFLAFFTLINHTIFSQTVSLAESVEYDSIGNRFLASSSANTSIVEIDLDGNLSLFGNGLSANLGMEIMGNYLFAIVATGNNQPVQMVKAYDLTTELEVMSITISSATVLNGMASDGISKLWVTDFQDPAIYEIDVADIAQPQFQKLLGSADIPNLPNGITYDGDNNRLVFVSWNDDKIRQVNLQDTSITEVFDSTIGNMDGIDMDDDGNFYVSSWTPTSRITKFSNDFSTSEILTIPGMTNPADICYASEVEILAIPSFQHDVILWSLATTTSVTDLSVLNKDAVKFYPNPANDKVYFEIPNLEWEKLDYTISNINGQTIHQTSLTNNGVEQIPIDLTELPSNQYIIQLIIDDKSVFTDKIFLRK